MREWTQGSLREREAFEREGREENAPTRGLTAAFWPPPAPLPEPRGVEGLAAPLPFAAAAAAAALPEAGREKWLCLPLAAPAAGPPPR